MPETMIPPSAAAVPRAAAPGPAPRRPHGWVPAISAGLAALVGLINVVSTLTPDAGGRAHALTGLLPDGISDLAHAIALPAGVALLVVAWNLSKRRRRAWAVAFSLLVALGVLNLLKGLDVEEATVSWALAGLLWWGRDAFVVHHDIDGWRGAVRRLALVATATAIAGIAAILAAWHWVTPQITTMHVIDQVLSTMTFTSGPLHFRHPFGWLPTALELLWAGCLFAVVYLVFRPIAAPRDLPEAGARKLAGEIVRAHGRDTLAFFKLREDKSYLFSPDRSAFLGYRVEGGVLLVSGDPVGPAEAFPMLISQALEVARIHGLKVGVVGASEELAELWRTAGLRSFYIGDEAIVDVQAFSLEGRKIRKVRQSVSRLQKAGYTAELTSMCDLHPDTLAAIEGVSDRWRDGDPERGFSMALPGLRGAHCAETLVLIARDGEGHVRGFLHFVPTYGRKALSLSFMRRERNTPNGLTEFLVVRAIEALKERDVEELSLNFAAFARLLHSPSSMHERFLGRLATAGDRWFQVESLYRFNAKFFPRWAPRYLCYQGALGLPRAGLAAMWAEGQLPKPGFPNERPAQPGAPKLSQSDPAVG